MTAHEQSLTVALASYAQETLSLRNMVLALQAEGKNKDARVQELTEQIAAMLSAKDKAAPEDGGA